MNKIVFSCFFLFLVLGLNAQLTNNGATIVIESGAKLIVEGNVSNNGTITNGGEFEIQGDLDNDSILTNTVGSKMIFSGVGNSLISSTSVLEINELDLNKTGGAITSLDSVNGNDVILTDALTFGANNFLAISNFDLTLAAIVNPIINAANDRFIITNGSGSVVRPDVATAASFTFPIGFSSSEYNPVAVTNNGAVDSIGARALEEAYSIGDDTNSAIAADAITASWELTGGSNIDLTVNWDAADVPETFDAAKSGVSRWDDVNGFWDLTIEDGLGVVGTSASRSEVMPGIFSVGGESVMDFILVLPRVVLSGAYDSVTNVMRSDLTLMLPNAEPYNGLGFTHAGLGGGETNSDFTGVVDWVFIEIREANSPFSIIGTYSALLKKNGDIVSTSGASHLTLYGFDSAKSYNVVIRHRNHLAVMSGSPITASRTAAVTYDMMNNDVYGTNGSLHDDGIYQMWAGDTDGNGTIKYAGSTNDTDAILNAVLNDPDNGFNSKTKGFSAYSVYDINLDGIVKYAGSNNDLDIILNSVLNHPNNGFNSKTFGISGAIQ